MVEVSTFSNQLLHFRDVKAKLKLFFGKNLALWTPGSLR